MLRVDGNSNRIGQAADVITELLFTEIYVRYTRLIYYIYTSTHR